MVGITSGWIELKRGNSTLDKMAYIVVKTWEMHLKKGNRMVCINFVQLKSKYHEARENRGFG